jgi:chromate transporter
MDVAERPRGVRQVVEVFWVALRLGLTSFGGPIAHLGYFREEYVVRRRWLDEATYADMVALCQFLPGPASSQVGIAVGMTRAGMLGGIAAWLGFTMPSAIALIGFAYGVAEIGNVADAGWLHGLKVVAVAVVAHAVWGMARNLAPDRPRATLAVVAAVTLLLWQTPVSQIAVILVGGLIGWRMLTSDGSTAPPLDSPVPRWAGIAAIALFFGLLAGLPVLAETLGGESLHVFDSFYRSGSMVFGGGHVVLPLLQAEVVPPGWITNDRFVAGYGAAQAVPGPLFTFAAYLGSSIDTLSSRWLSGLFTLAAVFLPSFLLIAGAFPFWNALRSHAQFRSALLGINAAVVGILLAALYQPVWTTAIIAPEDFALGLVAFGLLAVWKVAPWMVVLLTAAGGEAIARI